MTPCFQLLQASDWPCQEVLCIAAKYYKLSSVRLGAGNTGRALVSPLECPYSASLPFIFALPMEALCMDF